MTGDGQTDRRAEDRQFDLVYVDTTEEFDNFTHSLDGPHRAEGLTKVLYWTHLPVTMVRSSSVAALLGHDDVSGNDDVNSRGSRYDVKRSEILALGVTHAEIEDFMVR